MNPAPVQRLVGRMWDNSLAKIIWEDFTTLGKCTIAIPLIFIVYCILPISLVAAIPSYVLVKTGIANKLEGFLERLQNAFIK